LLPHARGGWSNAWLEVDAVLLSPTQPPRPTLLPYTTLFRSRFALGNATSDQPRRCCDTVDENDPCFQRSRDLAQRAQPEMPGQSLDVIDVGDPAPRNQHLVRGNSP